MEISTKESERYPGKKCHTTATQLCCVADGESAYKCHALGIVVYCDPFFGGNDVPILSLFLSVCKITKGSQVIGDVHSVFSLKSEIILRIHERCVS